MQRVPFLIVIGDREVENGQVAVRKRRGDDLGAMSVDEFSTLLTEDVEKMGRIA